MKRVNTVILTIVFLSLNTSCFAHTNLDEHSGIVTNLISLGIVLISILVYLIIDFRKKRFRK